MKTRLIFLLLFFIWYKSNGQMLEVKRGDYLLVEKKNELDKKVAAAVTEEEKKSVEEEKKTVNEDVTMKGLGNFTFNGRKAVPNIQILADRVSRSDEKSTARWYSKVEVFTQPDVTSSDQTEYKANFFIPEFSKYGINYTFAGCNVKNNDYDKNKTYDKAFIGFIFSTSFLEKSFKRAYDTLSIKKDFSTINSFISLGAELVFPKTYISVYGNVNLNSVLTNREAFLENLKTRERDFVFMTGGIRSQLNLSGQDDKSNVLSLDVGFIFQSNVISDFVKNSDFAIPLIRLNFRHSFLKR